MNGLEFSPTALHCSKCQTALRENEIFCPQCGFPERGTEQEKSHFNLRIRRRKELLEEFQKKVNTGQVILYIIASLFFLSGVVFSFLQEEEAIAVFVTFVILSCIYVGLAIWSNYQPFPALLTGFLLYVSIILLDLALDPASVLQGIVIKVVFIVVFIKGISSAREAKELKEELKIQGLL